MSPAGECQPDGAAIAYADIAPGIVCSHYDTERLTHSHVGWAEHVERGGRPADHRQDRRVRHKLVDAGAESVNQTAERHGSGKGLCAGAGRAALAVAERDRDGIARPQRGIAHAQLHDLFPRPHAEIGVKTRLQPGAVRRLHGHGGVVGGRGGLELRTAPVGGGMESHAKRAAIVNAVCADLIRQGPGPDTPGDGGYGWCEPSEAKGGRSARPATAVTMSCSLGEGREVASGYL